MDRQLVREGVGVKIVSGRYPVKGDSAKMFFHPFTTTTPMNPYVFTSLDKSIPFLHSSIEINNLK